MALQMHPEGLLPATGWNVALVFAVNAARRRLVSARKLKPEGAGRRAAKIFLRKENNHV
jgi:hypothetical protein